MAASDEFRILATATDDAVMALVRAKTWPLGQIAGDRATALRLISGTLYVFDEARGELQESSLSSIRRAVRDVTTPRAGSIEQVVGSLPSGSVAAIVRRLATPAGQIPGLPTYRIVAAIGDDGKITTAA